MQQINSSFSSAQQYANTFYTPKMTPDLKERIRREIEKIPVEDRPSVTRFAFSLAHDVKYGNTSEAEFWDSRDIIWLLQEGNKIPVEDRASVARHSISLISPRLNQIQRRLLITAVSVVPAKNRETMTPQSLASLVPAMNGAIRWQAISALSPIPPMDRESVIQCTLRLTKPVKGPFDYGQSRNHLMTTTEKDIEGTPLTMLNSIEKIQQATEIASSDFHASHP